MSRDEQIQQQTLALYEAEIARMKEELDLANLLFLAENGTDDEQRRVRPMIAARLLKITNYLEENCCEPGPSPYVVKECPKCSGGAVEIYTIEPPIGYTGVYQCMECDSTFDPTMPELN